MIETPDLLRNANDLCAAFYAAAPPRWSFGEFPGFLLKACSNNPTLALSKAGIFFYSTFLGVPYPWFVTVLLLEIACLACVFIVSRRQESARFVRSQRLAALEKVMAQLRGSAQA